MGDKICNGGSSLVAQWLRLHPPNAGGLFQPLVRELDPTSQLRGHVPQLKIPHAARKVEDPVCQS